MNPLESLGLSPLGAVGFGAVGMVVVVWLIVSFRTSSPRRVPLEWLGAVGLFVALFCLFVSLFLRARAADSTGGLVGFGFLATMFGLGLLVCTWKAVSSVRGGDSTDVSATN